MTDTSSLRTFIEARLAEDERGALIGGTAPDPWQAITDGSSGPAVRTGTDEAPEWQREVNYQMWHCDDEADGCPEIAREWIAEAKHIARHDPVRVIREVEAKRRMLKECAWTADCGQPGSAVVGLAEIVMKGMAAPYADHPDYRTEWSTA